MLQRIGRSLVQAQVAPRPLVAHVAPRVPRVVLFSAGDGSSPTSLSAEEAVAILESVLSFIRLGLPGRRLDEIRAQEGPGVQAKWQSMMEIRLQTELHTINAFGFEASQMGMLAYRQTMSALMQRAGASDLDKLQGVRDNQSHATLLYIPFLLVL